ncbi:hypothetical protein [Microlunatus parietis]|uniref:Uncharacterized protein n=1 Tax=Microlunatus parietis TaxID=682979 RepID=A0A7Y9I3B5_9ACTN|nr:hypothetical protein [Microlunatus parietis]NYE69485.1 hypothetical protein [Microlunatus parietis]
MSTTLAVVTSMRTYDELVARRSLRRERWTRASVPRAGSSPMITGS